LWFGSSDHLAAAYGIAVSATMLLTTALLFIAMREIWGWGLLLSGVVAGIFLCIDTGFFLANLTKVADGGYVPLILASLVYGVMLIWHRGLMAVARVFNEQVVPVDEFMSEIESKNIPRVPGTAVFLTRSMRDTPPVMVWHVTHSRALHEQLFVLRIETQSFPRIKDSERLSLTELGPNFWRGTARYGFMERPDIPALLRLARAQGFPLRLDDVTFYVGRETIVAQEDGKGLPGWQTSLFAAMERNAVHVTAFFKLPIDDVVEIGREIAI
jgi:KUP system potassium uptake protein